MTLAAIVLAATFARPLERVSTLDPVMERSAFDMRASSLVYEPMLAIDYKARPYRMIPGACEMPEVGADGLTYRFRLRSPELTATDVICTLEKMRDPANASPNAFIVKNVASMTAPDSRTLVIRLKEPQYVFPWMLTHANIARADGSGTGPFELVLWRKNHEMVFRRRARTAGVEKPFDVVRYLTIDDMSTQWLMFLKGEVDMLGDISRDNWDSVVGPDGRLLPSLAAQGVTLHETAILDSTYLGLNMADPVLGRNRKLRQALNCAFDFPAWKRFYNGRVERSDGPVPFGVAGRLETPFAYAYDLEKARRLLAEAGYPGGTDPATGRRLSLTLTIGRPDQGSRESGELIASFYERIGVRIELEFKTWDAYMKALNERRVQMFLLCWVGDYPDAENYMQLFHSSNVSPGPNHVNYVNPEFDREYEAALDAPTADLRNAHWLNCQEIVREDCPWIFTHVNKSYSLVRPTVGNYVPTDFP